MPSPWHEIALALVAMLCGVIVGSERQRREKPAGLRTLMLVCFGSALFTMVSFVFTTTTGDSGRVVAQIVTGIGFLGAGVIMHDRRLIVGATTAAMIWVTAAMGAVIGAGYPLAGLGVSILIRISMSVINNLEERSLRKIEPIAVTVDFERAQGLTRVKLQHIVGGFNVPASAVDWVIQSETQARLTLRLQLPSHHLMELLDEIISVPAVKAIYGLPHGLLEEPSKEVF